MIGETFLALSLAALMIVCVWILYAMFNDKRKAYNFYVEHVYAYKVGMIKKRAKETGVDLVFRTSEDKFLAQIEEGVEKRIEDASPD